MLKKTLLMTGLSLFIALTSFAQSQFEFFEDKHDFGTIIEGTDAIWEFKFKNIGKDTIKLKDSAEVKDVRASCGCTTPTWTKIIPPGEIGIVKAQFGSAGRPGIFNKNVTVSNKGSVIRILTIKGVVIKGDVDTVKYSAADFKKSAKISLDKMAYNFGKVERNQKVMTKIIVKNSGSDSLKIKFNQSACSCIVLKLMMENKKDKTFSEVSAIPAGKSGFIELTYTVPADGFNTDIITLHTTDLTNKRVSIALSAEVVASLQEKSPVEKEDKMLNPMGTK